MPLYADPENLSGPNQALNEHEALWLLQQVLHRRLPWPDTRSSRLIKKKDLNRLDLFTMVCNNKKKTQPQKSHNRVRFTSQEGEPDEPVQNNKKF